MTYKTTAYSIDPDILAGVHGMRSPIHRTIDITKVSPDAQGRKYLPPGTFYSDLGNGYCRPLARAKVTADTGTGTPTIPVSFAQPFFAGDLLRSLVPTGKVTITSASTGWAAADTITVTIAGQDFIYTVLAEDIGGSLTATNTAIAAKLVILLNAQAVRFVTATSAANVVTVQVSDDEEYTLAASDTGTNGTATAGSAALVGGQSVGTVLSVNAAAKTITLAANNATALIAGMSIGVPGKALGMMAQGILLDEWMPEQGLYTSLSIRADLLPYYDALIKADLPEIQAT